jgi:uncharacterized protein with ParB-like and HNH nuclease domain
MRAVTPHSRNVQQLLQSQLFSIDEYQGEYNCERKNMEELPSDLPPKFFSYYKTGEERRAVRRVGEYLLRSIIVTKCYGENYQIADQQRVSSPQRFHQAAT